MFAPLSETSEMQVTIAARNKVTATARDWNHPVPRRFLQGRGGGFLSLGKCEKRDDFQVESWAEHTKKFWLDPLGHKGFG